MIALIDADSLMFQACFNISDTKEALNKYDTLIESIRIECWCDETKVAVKGDNNFRYKLADDYKANRQSTPEEVTKWLPTIRAYALERGAIPVESGEADDLVSEWAWREGYQDCVVCHMDKDLDMIPGEHYNYHHNKMTHYTISHDEADYNFHMQLLMGDSADNIKCLHGIGPAKAAKILNGVDAHHRTDMVISLWERRVPNWQQELLKAGNLLWLRRYPEDKWTFKHNGETYEPEF